MNTGRNKALVDGRKKAPQVPFAEEPERKRRDEGPKGKGGRCGCSLLLSNVPHIRRQWVIYPCGKHLESVWVTPSKYEIGYKIRLSSI